ncbi:MAG: RodZ domain-containing protein [Candidatus Tumulicola sp.]
MPALGEQFRAAREARGLSLSDVSDRIRIRSVYLAAIEDENWKAIGAPVYVRGFLRTYARFLGLDPEEVVTAFNGHAGTVREAEATPSPSRAERTTRRGSLMVWIAAVVAVLLVAYVFYNALTLHREAVPLAMESAGASPFPSSGSSASGGPLAAGASPVASATPVATASANPANSLALVLSAPSWLRVTVDGSVSMEGTFPAGTAKTFHGKNALVRIGNAGGVEIYVDGKDVGKLGKLGDVAERAFAL